SKASPSSHHGAASGLVAGRLVAHPGFGSLVWSCPYARRAVRRTETRRVGRSRRTQPHGRPRDDKHLSTRDRIEHRHRVEIHGGIEQGTPPDPRWTGSNTRHRTPAVATCALACETAGPPAEGRPQQPAARSHQGEAREHHPVQRGAHEPRNAAPAWAIRSCADLTGESD